MLNRKIRQNKDPIQANARGAAFIASVGLGYLKWDGIESCCKVAKVYTPNPDNRQVYDSLYSEFINIYKIMGKTHKRLNS
ncbi:MAG: hypothetical protein P8Y23_14570 [Candidatus Lokiarchaeota archaeon]